MKGKHDSLTRGDLFEINLPEGLQEFEDLKSIRTTYLVYVNQVTSCGIGRVNHALLFYL